MCKCRVEDVTIPQGVLVMSKKETGLLRLEEKILLLRPGSTSGSPAVRRDDVALVVFEEGGMTRQEPSVSLVSRAPEVDSIREHLRTVRVHDEYRTTTHKKRIGDCRRRCSSISIYRTTRVSL